jgi:flagellin
MRVNTNVNSLVAYRNLSTANAAVSDSMAKLSTGFRINKAADDAAGLGIANKLRADNRALQQASRNAEQANSVLQMAEGATSTVQKMLERMKELATQAGSDSVDDAGRGRINAEFKALQEEITRTVDTTKFQGATLLDGSFGKAGAQLSSSDITISGTPAAGEYKLSVDDAGQLTVTGPSSFSKSVDLKDATAITGGVKFTVAGLGDISVKTESATDAASVKAGLNGRSFDVTAATTGSAATNSTLTMDAPAAFDFSGGNAKSFDVNVGGTTTTVALNTDVTDINGLKGAINSALTGKGVTVDVVGGKLEFKVDTAGATALTITDTDNVFGGGAGNVSTDTGKALVGPTPAGVDPASIKGNPTAKQASFLVGSSGAYTSDDLIKLNAIDLKIDTLGIDKEDLTSADGARKALSKIDSAMDKVSQTLGDIGASQNRIQYTQDNLKTTIVNFSAAESVIRDLDMAEEMTKFSKNNIISQAATAMLAQANQSTQGVLQLLRG